MNGYPPPSSAEIASSLYGAWRLFLGDVRAMDFLRPDTDGFWTALWTLLFAVPAYVLQVVLDLPAEDVERLGVFGLVVEAQILVLSGLVYALGMIYVARALERDAQYLQFIIATFWVGLAQTYLQAIPSVLRSLGIIPDAGASMFTLALFVVMLWWSWATTRITLEVNGGQAGIVVAGSVLFQIIFVVTLTNQLN